MSIQRPDVSVIFPVYKVEKYVEKSVRSIMAQTHKNIEIILVDDGSPDKSGEICDMLAKEDSRIKVIHKENGGTGYARNSGMEIATGEYLYFCDPDDIVEPCLIEDNYSIAKKYDADIVVFGFYKDFYDTNGNIISGTERLPKLDGVYDYKGFMENFRDYCSDMHQLWIRLYKSEFVTQNNFKFTNQRTGQDSIFNMAVYATPFNCIAFNRKSYYHYITRVSNVINSFTQDRFKCEFNIAGKFEGLVNGFGFTDGRYNDLITNSYIRGLNTVIRNISSPKSSLSLSEQTKYLKGIIKEPKIKKAIKDVKPKGFIRRSERIKIRLIKLGLIRLTLYLSKRKIESEKIGE